MPVNDDDVSLDTNTEVKFFGNEIAFSIGTRPVKIWEVLVALVILSFMMPILTNIFKGLNKGNTNSNRGSNGGNRGGGRGNNSRR